MILPSLNPLAVSIQGFKIINCGTLPIFLVEEDLEGGYTAQAVGEAIYTQAEDLVELRTMVRDAVQCHLEEDQSPKLTRLRGKVVSIEQIIDEDCGQVNAHTTH